MTAVTATTADTFRPALHYAARNTWLNDPNGLIFHDGVYHLYYQNNPLDNVWGNMSWGHATSTDLLTWTEHPVAIACDEEEDIFSGSIVFDRDNTSGFGTGFSCPAGRRLHQRLQDRPPHTRASRPSPWPTAWTAATPGPNTPPTPY